MGITPNTFLNAISRQLCGEDEDVLMMLEGAHLPPTYLPPESTQAMDATFYYVVCGMAILAAAFGQLIWNLVSIFCWLDSVLVILILSCESICPAGVLKVGMT